MKETYEKKEKDLKRMEILQEESLKTIKVMLTNVLKELKNKYTQLS
jgi:hypothetical protein